MTEELKTDELVITDENFDQYFFDVRRHEPKRGQVMALYSASAEFVEGPEKQQIIDLLSKTEKAIPTTQVMRKLLFASELDAIRVPRLMAQDLLDGMSVDEVLKKPYKYTVEMYFYTTRECVPKDDPHWSVISVVNLEDFLDKRDDRIKSRLLKPEEV